MTESKDALYQAALEYHKAPGGAGKIAIMPTKALATSRDLSLAYSPGVAAPCQEIAANPLTVNDYTSRGNLVAVITNGTAVLGLGDIGPLAAKPVMEGKAVLFKKFAGIDSIDIEIDEKNIDKIVDIIASLEPSFGGINLEDIKAPECFEIERRLKERMKIPVFHDDQHGTAIIVGAAVTNWLKLSGRKAEKVKLVCSGAGAAAIACLNILTGLGIAKKNIFVGDKTGIIYKGRNEGMDSQKEQYAQDTPMRTMREAIKGADIFLGLSGPGAIDKDMVASMAKAPLILALANPTPEIMPEDAIAAKPDAVIATGRSDYPNQVNNALCFPYIFRGALDVGATAINEEMKQACVKALASLTMAEASAEVAALYGDMQLKFGPEYLIPKPFDQRLILELAPAVAKAAMDSGVATRPISDFTAYRQQLEKHIFKSGQLMRPVYARASADPKKIAFAEGEDPRVLHAVQTIVDDHIAKPILVGREEIILERIKKLGLRLEKGRHFELVNSQSDPRFDDYWMTYHDIMARKGVSPATAKHAVRTSNTIIASLLVYKGHADGMICGTMGRYNRHLRYMTDVIGLAPGVKNYSALSVLIHPKGTFFITDAYVNANPSAEQIAETTIMAAAEVLRFGVEPKIALLAHSDFGMRDDGQATKMKEAVRLIKELAPDLEVDGEMTADAAFSEEFRRQIFPKSTLTGQANLLVTPNIESANILLTAMKFLSDAIAVGPILLGTAKPAYILTPAVTSRGVINAAALASLAAQLWEETHLDTHSGKQGALEKFTKLFKKA